MLARGGGVIVNTGSMSGILADVTRSMYGITKTAIMGLTNTIATQYGRQGIRCVTIAPGLVLTPAAAAVMSPEEIAHHARQSPLNRGAEPSDVAELVAFLASDGGAYISGETIRLDGGMGAHLPSFADDIAVA